MLPLRIVRACLLIALLIALLVFVDCTAHLLLLVLLVAQLVRVLSTHGLACARLVCLLFGSLLCLLLCLSARCAAHFARCVVPVLSLVLFGALVHCCYLYSRWAVVIQMQHLGQRVMHISGWVE